MGDFHSEGHWRDSYIKRTGIKEKNAISSHFLKHVHECHVQKISFEMLDCFLGIDPEFNINKIINKVIYDNRGGGCTDMNGVFSEYLSLSGFNVSRIMSCAWNPIKKHNTFTHMAVIVEVDDARWFCDVGYGYRGPVWPIKLAHNNINVQGVHRYRVFRKDNGSWQIDYLKNNNWQCMYLFRDISHSWEDFRGSQFYNYKSPDALFRKNLYIARPTLSGGVFILGDKLISLKQETKTTVMLNSVNEIIEVLRQQFYIELSDSVKKLLQHSKSRLLTKEMI